MPLQAGSRLGPYELAAPIGAGGMGEVWRGRDTRLDRSVAIKVLPAGFAEDEERRVRFEREARTISSLNHPHICTLFDVGRENASHFLVMELLDGESLADRLLRSALPLEQVVKFGAQVAEALDAAHKQGIVHRDLKPGNVVITKTGAKLLDFGLARSAAPVAVASSTELATEVKPLTSAGTLLGTFQYMAPEQVEGAEADPRTDIFALGALLYEMATGRRAFEGKSKTSLVAAILSTQPPAISQVQPVMPPALDHVVRKCLEKDPDDRWQSAHDVAAELRWIAEAGSQAGVPATLSLRRRSRERLAWGLAAAMTAAAATGLGWALHARKAAEKADRLLQAELVAAGVALAPVVQGAPALSPDGQRLGFVAADAGGTDLAVRDLATGETKRLAGTTGATFPFWSPDSRWIAFFAEGRLKKVEAAGGPVQIVCEAHAGRGGSWSPDGTIVFAPDISGPLFRVPAGGGALTAVTRTADSKVTHRNPWFLPDGRHFLFTIRDTLRASFGAVAVASVDGGEPKTLLPRGSNPQYADGFLFTVVDGNLVAQRLGAGEERVEGQAVPIADSIDYWNPRDLAAFSVSRAGLLVYRRVRLRSTQIVWLDRAGKELATVGEPSYYAGLSLRADGQALAAVRCDATGSNTDVWLVDLLRSQTTRSTFLSASTNYIGAAVSPDGGRLAVTAYWAGGSAGSGFWVQPTAGGGSRQAFPSASNFNVYEWSSDGAYLLGDAQEAESGFDLAYVALADPSKVVHINASRFDERAPALSRDGRWIAYQSDETGRNEVFVTDFPAGSRKWQLSRSGGQAPSWRSDSREVYFRAPDGPIAVPVVERGEALDPGGPERLPFPKEKLRPDGRVLSPDGRRFLVERYASEDFAEPLRLVRGWHRIVDR